MAARARRRGRRRRRARWPTGRGGGARARSAAPPRARRRRAGRARSPAPSGCRAGARRTPSARASPPEPGSSPSPALNGSASVVSASSPPAADSSAAHASAVRPQLARRSARTSDSALVSSAHTSRGVPSGRCAFSSGASAAAAFGVMRLPPRSRLAHRTCSCSACATARQPSSPSSASYRSSDVMEALPRNAWQSVCAPASPIFTPRKESSSVLPWPMSSMAWSKRAAGAIVREQTVRSAPRVSKRRPVKGRAVKAPSSQACLWNSGKGDSSRPPSPQWRRPTRSAADWNRCASAANGPMSKAWPRTMTPSWLVAALILQAMETK